ncbi:hypothetical protein GCM10007984_14490 [Shewanella putrefaciens]|jgi:hypothetical protein|nr:hypothetical protein GCM10007984_14490 [Shewanella putrefaciens]
MAWGVSNKECRGQTVKMGLTVKQAHIIAVAMAEKANISNSVAIAIHNVSRIQSFIIQISL